MTELREANCDLVALGTIVRDAAIIISTIEKPGWSVDLLGPAASARASIP